MYRSDPDALLIVAVFKKTTQKTPKSEIENCKKRLFVYDDVAQKSMAARKKKGDQ